MRERIEDPDALNRAADAAVKDGDYEHARILRMRANSARRQLRERDAGVSEIGWDFPRIVPR